MDGESHDLVELLPRMVAYCVLSEKVPAEAVAKAASMFFEEIRACRLSFPFTPQVILPPPDLTVFYRQPWRGIRKPPVEQVIRRLRDSAGKHLIIFASISDSVEQMASLAESVLDYGAIGCSVFTPRMMFTTGDLETIQESGVSHLFTLDLIHGGTDALGLCSKIIPLRALPDHM